MVDVSFRLEQTVAFKIEGVCPLLQVFDMPTAVRFYRDLLGFELVGNSPVVKSPEGEYFHWAMLRRDDVTLMLNTAYDEGERPAAPDGARIAAHGDTSLFFGCADVDGTSEELVRREVMIVEKPMVTRYGMKRFTIVDPDGYNLCFQGPIPGS